MERRDFLGAALGGAGVAGLAMAASSNNAAAQAAGATKSKLDEVLARGKVIVGVTSEAPPFGFIDDKGELVGFDIDMAKLVAKAIFNDETKIELFKQGFAARWPNVQNGSIDFGIMVTTVYADRALRVGFTRPYIDSGIVLVVKKDSPIKTVADLNKADYTVAHLTTPVQEERGKRLLSQCEVSHLRFDLGAVQCREGRPRHRRAARRTRRPLLCQGQPGRAHPGGVAHGRDRQCHLLAG